MRFSIFVLICQLNWSRPMNFKLLKSPGVENFKIFTRTEVLKSPVYFSLQSTCTFNVNICCGREALNVCALNIKLCSCCTKKNNIELKSVISLQNYPGRKQENVLTQQGGGAQLFLRFSKMDTLLPIIGMFYMSSIPKIGKFGHALAQSVCVKVLIWKKSQRPLKGQQHEKSCSTEALGRWIGP